MAPFPQAYGIKTCDPPTLATLEAILIILPLPALTIRGAIALHTIQVPLTFTENILSHSSSVHMFQGLALMPTQMAALLTRISTLPYCCMTVSAIFWTSPATEMS